MRGLCRLPALTDRLEANVGTVGQLMTTPYEVNTQGQPLHWADRLSITVSDSLPAQFQPILSEAEQYIEDYANIRFVDVTGTGANADISVGAASLGGMIGLAQMRFVGNTFISASVWIEEPNEHPVVPLSDGDFQYQDSTASMFNVLTHELLHAMGLDHNTTDPTDIMYPVALSDSQLITTADAEALQGLYGATQTSAPLPSIVIAHLIA
jgi:predicted Zn-dependent protease